MSTQSQKITILTPTLNGLRFLPEAVESVRCQNATDVQHIIMDGGSTDGSVEWLRNQPDSNIVWRSEPDRGQSHALNKALELATGDIIGWVNSDDRFCAGAFEQVLAAFARNPQADVVCGDYYLIDATGRRFEEMYTQEWGFESLVLCGISGALVGQPATFFRRRLVETIGNFDVNLHYCMDWDYWIRARQTGPFAHVEDFLAEFRVHGSAKTAADLTHMDEVIEMCDRYVPKLPTYRRTAAQKMLDDRRAQHNLQKAAVEAVIEQARERLNARASQPTRLVIFALGNNGRRLYRRLGELMRGRNVETMLVDDNAGRNPLMPDGVMRSEQIQWQAPSQLIVVTPWDDAAIMRKLTALGIQPGPDLIRWSQVNSAALVGAP